MTTNSAAADGKASKVGIASLKQIAPRMLALAWPFAQTLLLGLLALALGTGVNLAFPYFIRAALNEEFGLSLEQDLDWIVLILIGLFAFQALCFFVRHYCFQSVGYRVVADIRQKLFDAMLQQDVAFFDRARLGDLLSRLSSDTELLQRALTINISVAIRYLIQVIGGVVLMLFISVKLTLLLILALPLIVGASVWWGKMLRRLSRKMQEQLGDAAVIAEEAMSSIRTVKVFAGAEYENSRYASDIDKALSTGLQRTKVAALFSSTMVFIMHTAIALVVWYGGRQILSAEMSVGDLAGFLLYCVIVAVSFGFLAGTWAEFMQAVGAGERIFEILDHTRSVLSPTDPLPLPDSTSASLRFENVSFSYPTRDEQLSLHDISFELHEGQTVALVGPSGAGKTTIANLVARYYDPQVGQVFFNGVDVRKLALDQLRDSISIVAQQPEVFSRSIEDNIRYGRITASQKEIQQAAEAANIHQFISELPQGYQTHVGDKGVQLSGGERQRIAIARALLKNPRFLILDEATSALDSENERLVQEALERLVANRSTLIIAHRLSTVQHADLVLVLDQGKIVQRGTHQSLLADTGLYQTLVQHQLIRAKSEQLQA